MYYNDMSYQVKVFKIFLFAQFRVTIPSYIEYISLAAPPG